MDRGREGERLRARPDADAGQSASAGGCHASTQRESNRSRKSSDASSGERTRTPIHGIKTRCPTIERPRKGFAIRYRVVPRRHDANVGRVENLTEEFDALVGGVGRCARWR